MVKLKVAKGFSITNIVLMSIAIFFCLISLLALNVVLDVIKDLVIQAGGSTVINGNPLTLIMQNITTISELDVEIDDAALETLDTAGLELMYLIFCFAKTSIETALGICLVGLTLSIITLVFINKAKSKSNLVAPMVLSFVNSIFAGIFALVAGILLACVSQKDFDVVG